MSSIRRCIGGFLSSARSIGRARVRSTGCPMRATLRIDMTENYTAPLKAAGRCGHHEGVIEPHGDAHDAAPDYRFCPRCGGALATRVLKTGDPERLVCDACGFVFYLD